MHMSGEDRVAFPSLGIDTYNDFGLWLTGFTDEAPELKTYTVDVPGGNGVIDLTEALLGGDVAYGQGYHTFELTFPELVGFHELKTKVRNLLHGRRLDYSLSWEPGYTYTGRVAVSSEENFTQEYGTITLEVERDPFKLKENAVRYYDISNGVLAYVVSGRKTVQPTFEFSDDTIVVFEGERVVMPAGSYKLTDVWFREGMNEVFMLPAAYRSYTTHKELASLTWEQLRKERRVFEIYKGAQKWLVSRIEVKGTATATTGVLTFTAEDEDGNESVGTLDIGSLQVVEGDGIVIDDGYAKVSVYAGEVTPTVYTFEFPELYSTSGPIVSLTADCAGDVTYQTDSTATTHVYRVALHSDHEGKTYAELAACRHLQLMSIDTGTEEVHDMGGESAYIQFDWREL